MKNYKTIIRIFLLFDLFISFSNDIFCQLESMEGVLIDNTELQWIENLPKLEPTLASLSKLLPYEVDNTDQIFWPGGDYWINQEGWNMCASAAITYNCFTYEHNRKENLPSNDYSRLYAPNWTWNFLNDGGNNGSYLSSTFEILQSEGAVTVENWGDFNLGDYKKWMSGYDKYLAAMNKRILEVYKIDDLENPDQLNLLKHWLSDHNAGDEIGGVAVISDQFNMGTVILPPQSAYAGEKAISHWGTASSHALTIVGYCDGIKWDFNDDQQFTNGEFYNLNYCHSNKYEYICQ